jgi:adenylate cyclase
MQEVHAQTVRRSSSSQRLKPNLDVQLLRSFLAVAQSRSLRKAAEKCLRSPAAVSLQIKKLEDTLGFALFARQPQGLTLTTAGERFAEQARLFVTQHDAFVGSWSSPIAKNEPIIEPSLIQSTSIGPNSFGSTPPSSDSLVTASAGHVNPLTPSLAVLPFENPSGDMELALFADGLVEDLITGLSRTHSLLVIGRNSSFTYKGRAVSAKDVGSDLGVQYIIEGSVRRANDRIRVTAQLVDVFDGANIWADRFDRTFSDPFVLQDDLTRIIVASTQQQLYLSEGRTAGRRSRTNTALWTLLHRSWTRLHDLTPEGVAEALQLAEQALDIDPDSARANLLVACVLMHGAVMYFHTDYEHSIHRARLLVEKSIALYEPDEHAHWISGHVNACSGDEHGAIVEFERMLEINPNFSLGLGDYGESLCYLGQLKEGLAKIRLAIRMNPRDPSIFIRYNSMSAGLYFSGSFQAAERWGRKAVSRGRQYHLAYVFLMAALVRLDRLEEAKTVSNALLKLFPTYTTGVLRRMGFIPRRHEELFDELKAAGVPT